MGRIGYNQNVANKITPNPETAAKGSVFAWGGRNQTVAELHCCRKRHGPFAHCDGKFDDGKQAEYLKNALAFGLAGAGATDTNYHASGYGPLELGAAALFGGSVG